MSRRIQPLSLLLFAVDLGLVPVALWAAGVLRSSIQFGRAGALPEVATRVPWPFYLLAVLVWGISLVSAGVYQPQLALRWFNEAWRVIVGSAVATVLLSGSLYMTYRELSRLQFVYFFIMATGMLLAYRAGLRLYYRALGRSRPGGRNRILILGAGELGVHVAEVLLDHSRWGYHPVGFLDDDPAKLGRAYHGLSVLGPLDGLKERIRRNKVDELWIALPAGAIDRLSQIIGQVETEPVRIKVVPDYFSYALIQTKPEAMGDLPIIGLRDPLIEGVPRIVKRIFDVLFILLFLPLTLPIMAAIGLSILIDSGRPVFFWQERVGENGMVFNMLKFRTMVPDAADEDPEVLERNSRGQVVHKTREDPRVTRIGRFLRRFSLDELPQLWNVIKGEMSLVGPRPEMPWLVDRYDPWQRKRFAVPQGITGWWQINGRSDHPMHLHTEDDLYYVYNYSLWLDILILLRTPWVVLKGWGAF